MKGVKHASIEIVKKKLENGPWNENGFLERPLFLFFQKTEL